MYLLYLDDSGSAQNPNEQYLVLGGISVFERRAYFIQRELEELATQLQPTDPESAEFHASEVFSGKKAPWSGIKSKEERKAILQKVLAVLSADGYGSCAFACAVHKASFPNDDPMEIAFEEVCNSSTDTSSGFSRPRTKSTAD